METYARRGSSGGEVSGEHKYYEQCGAEFVCSLLIYSPTPLIINKMMIRIVLALFLVALTTQNCGSQYFLSPPLPPTAFIGQFYTAQFRVLGLDNPNFKFEGLPKWFKGYKDGTLSGTPKKAGSYPVRVLFSTPGCDSHRDIVIRVAPSISSTEGYNRAAGVMANERFIVVNNEKRTFTYKTGDKINLDLKASRGKAPYAWTYLNLPSGLVGTKQGRVYGHFDQVGYYSFSASANDANGHSADCYYTFNIQPASAVASNLIEVPNRNIPVQYDIHQVERQQLQASTAVFAAIKVVNHEKQEVEAARQFYGKTTLALNFATSQENAAQAKVTAAAAKRARADAAQAKAHDILEVAHKVVRLAITNVNNQRKVVAIAKADLEHAQEIFNLRTQKFEEANNVFINAEAQTSQAAQNAKAALTAALNAQNVYNLAFRTYRSAKKILAVSLDKKTQADLVVNAARNALNLAIQVNDEAQSSHKVAVDVYRKMYSALDNANFLVSKIRAELQDAMDKLGVAKFNLQQANNNLFVAQARKEQADKATAIVKTQSSTLPDPESSSTYIFAGCDQHNYPTIVGADIVGAHNKYGFKLHSGYTLLHGACTSTQKVAVADGDVVEYVGYLKDGYVHATSYRKH